MEHRPSFAVVIPMYNEEAGAAGCVRAVCAALQDFPNRKTLIAVNDGSRDRTGAILAELESQEPMLTVVTHPRNLGYGAGLQSGVRRAAQDGFDYVLFMDSDLTNDPCDINKFTAQMEAGVDVIKASRYVTNGRMEGVPLKRAAISRVGNAIAQILFGLGIRDCTNGFRAVRTSILGRMNLRENSFPVIVEELYNCKFLANTFCEVPVILTNRKADQRVTSFSYKPQTFLKYLKFALLAFLRIRPASSLEKHLK